MDIASPTSDGQRRLSILLLVASLLLLVTLLGAFFLVPAHATFAPSPDHPSILQSRGEGSHPALGWGYAVGVSIL